MLTGKFPYEFSQGRDPIDVILNEDAVPVRKRDKVIPSKLAAVLDKALAKKVKDRYQTAGEMRAALERTLT